MNSGSTGYARGPPACQTPGCNRTTEGGFPNCCRACQPSNGRQHGPRCDARHGFAAQPKQPAVHQPPAHQPPAHQPPVHQPPVHQPPVHQQPPPQQPLPHHMPLGISPQHPPAQQTPAVNVRCQTQGCNRTTEGGCLHCCRTCQNTRGSDHGPRCQKRNLGTSAAPPSPKASSSPPGANAASKAAASLGISPTDLIAQAQAGGGAGAGGGMSLGGIGGSPAFSPPGSGAGIGGFGGAEIGGGFPTGPPKYPSAPPAGGASAQYVPPQTRHLPCGTQGCGRSRAEPQFTHCCRTCGETNGMRHGPRCENLSHGLPAKHGLTPHG